MQNTTTARPATTGKRGIQLNQQLFRKAIEKAQAINPRVVHVGAYYGVMQSDGRHFATVIFRVYDNRLFASCTCYAHTRGDANLGKNPVPCYHIAAAALSRHAIAGLSIDPTPAPKIAVPRAYPRHDHACPACRDLYACWCSHGETDDLICDDCGSEQLDWAASFGHKDYGYHF